MLINTLGTLRRHLMYTGEQNERTLQLSRFVDGKTVGIQIPAGGAWRFADLGPDEKRELEAIFLQLRSVGKEKIWGDTPQRAAAEIAARQHWLFDAALSLFDFSIALRAEQDNTTLFAILDSIRDGLDDLHKMKPFEAAKKPVAEFTATINGERHSGEVTA